MAPPTNFVDHRALETVYQFISKIDLPRYRRLVDAARETGDYTPETYGTEEPKRNSSDEALGHRLNLCEEALQKIDTCLMTKLEELRGSQRSLLVRLMALSHASVAMATSSLLAALLGANALIMSLVALGFLSSFSGFFLTKQVAGNRFGSAESAVRCKKLRTRANIALAALLSVDRSEKLSNYEVEDELVEIEKIIEELQEI